LGADECVRVVEVALIAFGDGIGAFDANVVGVERLAKLTHLALELHSTDVRVDGFVTLAPGDSVAGVDFGGQSALAFIEFVPWNAQRASGGILASHAIVHAL